MILKAAAACRWKPGWTCGCALSVFLLLCVFQTSAMKCLKTKMTCGRDKVAFGGWPDSAEGGEQRWQRHGALATGGAGPSCWAGPGE